MNSKWELFINYFILHKYHTIDRKRGGDRGAEIIVTQSKHSTIAKGVVALRYQYIVDNLVPQLHKKVVKFVCV